MVTVCFVCLGNICRSPTAEGVMRKLVSEAGLSDRIECDSAGTAAYHAGEAPDPRSRSAAKRRGVTVSGRARQFLPGDWQRFDYVIAMDTSNYEALQETADPSSKKKLFLLRSFDPQSPTGASVPDPYYGGPSGFDDVLDQCEAACGHLLERIVAELGA